MKWSKREEFIVRGQAILTNVLGRRHVLTKHIPVLLTNE